MLTARPADPYTAAATGARTPIVKQDVAIVFSAAAASFTRSLWIRVMGEHRQNGMSSSRLFPPLGGASQFGEPFRGFGLREGGIHSCM